jgi:hypothetical protein
MVRPLRVPRNPNTILAIAPTITRTSSSSGEEVQWRCCSPNKLLEMCCSVRPGTGIGDGIPLLLLLCLAAALVVVGDTLLLLLPDSVLVYPDRLVVDLLLGPIDPDSIDPDSLYPDLVDPDLDSLDSPELVR